MMRRNIVTALMVSVIALPAARSETWAGLYQKEDGGVVAIGEMHEFGHNEILVDYTTGETGPLFELDHGQVGIGRALGDKTPPPARVLERREGQILLDGHRLNAIETTRRTF